MNQPPHPYPAPPGTAPTWRTPLLRRGWFIVLTAVLVVGVLGGVLGTALRDVVPTPPGLSGLDGAIPPGFGDPSAPPVDGAVGAPARDGDVEFVVSGVECGIDRIGDETFGIDAVGQFCIVSLDATNLGAAPVTVIDFLQELHDADGTGYTASIGGSIHLSEAAPSVGPLGPGETRQTRLAYDVPDDAVPAAVELHGGADSGPGVRVPLR